MKILKGDKVQVILGKDKGRTGEVMIASNKAKTVLVKGINLFKKHIKPQSGQAGSIIEKERALTISKVALICPSCQKMAKVSYQIDKSGEKYRICRKCKSIITRSEGKK